MAINALNIPTGIGPLSTSASLSNANSLSNNSSWNKSYSGLGSGWTNWSGNTVQPLLSGVLGNYPNFINSAYNDASSGINAVAQSQLAPAMQGVINKLASRGMINSSVAGDAMSKTASGILDSLLSNQTSLNANRAGALAQYPSLLMNAAQLGQYSSGTGGANATSTSSSLSNSSSSSSDTSTPYRIMASLLSGMM